MSWLGAIVLGILGFILCIGMATVLAGCEPPSITDGTWTLVERCPDGTGIYKKYNAKEKVTFYATVDRYPSIAAVKD